MKSDSSTSTSRSVAHLRAPQPFLRLLPAPGSGPRSAAHPVALRLPKPSQPQNRTATLVLTGLGVLAARLALQHYTDRRAAETSRNLAFAELLFTVRQRDEALVLAAHDLKTPLTTLKGQAQLLQRVLRATNGPEAERLRAGLAAIDAAATAAAARIDRLTQQTERRPPPA